MYSPKTIGRLMSGVVAVLTLFCGQISVCFADADSISINFAPQRGTPTGGDLGVVPVNYSYWNNMTSSSGDDVSGSFTSLKNNTGVVTATTGSWGCQNTWNFNGTKPNTDNNAILYYGYLDDTNSKQNFTMTSPYFSYDLYYYPSTDSTGFRCVQLNVNDYSGDGTTTVYGKNNWGTPVKANIDASAFKEGVNYLKISSDYSTIKINGVNNNNGYRGSFGALQIVNTANSQSTEVTGDFKWTDAVWKNDLTGTTNQTPDATAVGYRLINNGNTATVDLNGSTVNLSNVKMLGSGSMTFTNGTTKLGKANTVYNFADFNGTVVLPNVGSSEPQGVVKFNSNVSTSDTTSTQTVIPGAYFINGSTTTFAQLSNGKISAATTTTTVSEGANLLVTSRVTDNTKRTLTALTSQADYVNNNALTLSSGMLTLQTNNHWVQGGGTITSGYKNSDGEYDLYLCALGTTTDMRIYQSSLINNPNGTMNVIKTGTGEVGITNSTNTYTGSTSVLEGSLRICANLKSTEFYIAKDANLKLDTTSISWDGKTTLYYGDYDFTATALSGYGNLHVGHIEGTTHRGSLTLNDVANDGSMLQTAYFYGKYVELNNSDMKVQWIRAKSSLTLNGDSTLYCMEYWGDDTNSITINDTATLTVTTSANFQSKSTTFTQNGGTVNTPGLTNLNGTYTMTGGTLNIGSSGINSGTLKLEGGTITAGSTDVQKNVRGNWSSGCSITLTGTKTESADTRVTFKPESGYSITLSGKLSGDGGLIKDGAGSMTISTSGAGNTYTGGTLVKSGTLNLLGDNTGGSSIGSGDLVIESGATVFAQKANVFGFNNICNVILNGGTLKNSGYLHVRNITLNGGTLNSSDNSPAYGGLDFYTRNGSITVTDNANIDTKIINSSTLTIDVAEGKTFTFSGNSNVRNASGKSSTVDKTGKGTIVSSNWFEDKVNIKEGTIKLVNNFGSENRFAGTLTVYEGGTVDLAAKDALGYSANACTINLYGGTLLKSGGENETLSNKIINLKGGTITSTYVNDKGETVDSKATMDIYQTRTQFNSLAEEGATADNPTVSTVDALVRLRATESFAINTEANSKLVFTKTISCVDDGGIARSITKSGDGVLELQANNTYYGGTTINAGTLKLSGEGNIVGSLTMNNDSVLDLTTKNGPLKLDSVSMSELSVLKVTLNKENGVLSIDSPLAGESLDNITLNGTLEVLLTGDMLDCGDIDTLSLFASANNELLGMVDSLVIDPTGNQLPPSMFFTLVKDGNSAYIQLGVPEPSTWALMILGLVGLWQVKRFSSRKK